MQKREKYLLIGVIALVVVWRGGPMLYSALFGEIESLKLRLATATERVNKKELERRQADRDIDRLENWTARSLPPNPLDAQRLYQQWITDLALLSGFQQLKVTSERRVPKAKTSVGVEIALEAEATLDQLSRFLFHFYGTDLMHRVARLEISSPETTGNPPLKIKLMAEGLSIQRAPRRERLFPETTVAREVAADAVTLPVQNATGFPTRPGFRVRLGSEFLKVTAINKNDWTVARGLDGTRAAKHAAGEIIELTPTSAAFANRTFDDYRKLIAASPFVKPQKYNPQLAPLGEQIVIRGTPWKTAVNATGFDPALGSLVYSLAGELPEGLSIDPKTGELSWNPGDGISAGRFRGTVTVSPSESPAVKLSQPLQVTLRERNQPPVVAPIRAQTAYLGSLLSFAVSARDGDDPPGKLSYRLESAPDGATIDPATGTVEWTPPLTVAPGEYEMTVVVSDDGAPPQSASQTVKLSVADDAAQFTYLVAAIDADNERQAWLYDRSTNRKLIVREGTTFSIADITAQVLTIGPDFVLLERGSAPWRLELGQNVRSMERLDAKPSPVTDSPDARGTRRSNAAVRDEATSLSEG